MKAKKYKFNAAQRKWLRALESGKYAQTRDALCDGKGFCCLGVACDVLGAPFTPPEEGGDYQFGVEQDTYLLPEKIRAQLKLFSHSGELKGRHTIGKAKNVMELTDANDSGAKFTTIAKFIRTHPEAVFTDA